ncbi:hypothetical protein EBU60_04645 [bacterium]|nr:hypothetical protein [bacterium]
MKRTRSVYWSVTSHGDMREKYWWVPKLRRWMTFSDARETGASFSSNAQARTARQAERIALRMPDTSLAILTKRVNTRSKKWPNGYERDYGLG